MMQVNKGIAMSTGDIVGILNSDDYFTSDDVVSNLMKPFSDPSLDRRLGDIILYTMESPIK